MVFKGLTEEENIPSKEDLLPSSAPLDYTGPSLESMEAQIAVSNILSCVESRYHEARDARRGQEQKWLSSYMAWRGEYSAQEQAEIQKQRDRTGAASSVFIKITKTKSTAALGQLQEILFPNDKFPIGVEPTPVVEGISESVHVVPENFPIEDVNPYGYNGDGRNIDPGTATQKLLGGMYEKWKQLTEGKKLVSGQSPDTSQMPQINPAQEAADNMEKTILDQLGEGKVQSEIRRAMWECAVLGTGVIKGPMTYKNVTHSWKKNEQGEIIYSPVVENTPRSFFVSIWNFYPDPYAQTIASADYIIEKHFLTKNQLSNLKRYSEFENDQIDFLLKIGARRDTKEPWEDQIREVTTNVTDNRYEILEYWGTLEKEHIEQFKPSLKKLLNEFVDQAQVNVWVCQGRVIRLVLNPFVPTAIPYYAVPFEEHDYQIWGISIPENMIDAQMLMNGHTRMSIDNLRLAGNVMLEVNESQMAPGQDYSVYPGKIWRKQGGAPGQSIYSIGFKDTSQSHMQAYDKARQLADEVTGQPSYSYGQTGVAGTTRTAAGMSMLMSAAAGNIKQVVKNFDEFLFKPLGEAYFSWNMQFNEKADIRGDVKIVAKGTSALMQREVQSQRLLQFLQIVGGNQLFMPMVNATEILKQVAKSLDLDPDKVVNDTEAAKLLADIMKQVVPQGGVGPQMGMEAPAGANPSDMTGGGGSNIGVGAAAQPGEEQFAQ